MTLQTVWPIELGPTCRPVYAQDTDSRRHADAMAHFDTGVTDNRLDQQLGLSGFTNKPSGINKNVCFSLKKKEASIVSCTNESPVQALPSNTDDIVSKSTMPLPLLGCDHKHNKEASSTPMLLCLHPLCLLNSEDAISSRGIHLHKRRFLL